MYIFFIITYRISFETWMTFFLCRTQKVMLGRMSKQYFSIEWKWNGDHCCQARFSVKNIVNSRLFIASEILLSLHGHHSLSLYGREHHPFLVFHWRKKVIWVWNDMSLSEGFQFLGSELWKLYQHKTWVFLLACKSDRFRFITENLRKTLLQQPCPNLLPAV